MSKRKENLRVGLFRFALQLKIFGLDDEQTCILGDLLMNLDHLVYMSYKTDYPIKRLERFMVGCPQSSLRIDKHSKRVQIVHCDTNTGVETVIEIPVQSRKKREEKLRWFGAEAHKDLE